MEDRAQVKEPKWSSSAVPPAHITSSSVTPCQWSEAGNVNTNTAQHTWHLIVTKYRMNEQVRIPSSVICNFSASHSMHWRWCAGFAKKPGATRSNLQPCQGWSEKMNEP